MNYNAELRKKNTMKIDFKIVIVSLERRKIHKHQRNRRLLVLKHADILDKIGSVNFLHS